jgi:hypothetical protein
MRFAALALAICFSFAPIEGATSQASVYLVKTRKSKPTVHKAPKRNRRPRNRTRTRTL